MSPEVAEILRLVIKIQNVPMVDEILKSLERITQRDKTNNASLIMAFVSVLRIAIEDFPGGKDLVIQAIVFMLELEIDDINKLVIANEA